MKIIITDHARDQFSKRVMPGAARNDVLRAILTWENRISYTQGRVTRMILKHPDGELVAFILKDHEDGDSMVLKTCYKISPMKFRNLLRWHCQISD